MIRTSYQQHAGGSRPEFAVSAAILECKVGHAPDEAWEEGPGAEENGGEEFRVVDMDFFDEESLAVVYRSYTSEG